MRILDRSGNGPIKPRFRHRRGRNWPDRLAEEIDLLEGAGLLALRQVFESAVKYVAVRLVGGETRA
jgi:hypothetical protein